MALILDTHTLIWIGADYPRLGASARAAIMDSRELIFVSAVTAWEYVDLAQRGRIPEAASFETLAGLLHFEVIDLPAEIWQICSRLPDIHRDPIDRMLIAHAIVADYTLITADRDMRLYPVRTIW